MQNKADNVRFVRLATLALISLLHEKRPARYIVRPPTANFFRSLARARDRRQSRAEAICGLGLLPSDFRRFWPKVRVVESGCWEWQGFLTEKGYGKFTIDEDHRFAHRVSYEFFKGKLPEGLTLDHLCFNKQCVNPDHLEAVTQSENSRRFHARIGTAA